MDDNLPVITESQFNAQFGGGDDDLPTIKESEFNQLAAPRASWGESAKFVGSSLAKGIGGTVGLLLDASPANIGLPQEAKPSSTLNQLITGIFGKPEDYVVGKPAEVIGSAVEASTFPLGGPVVNALSGIGGKVAEQMYPDNPIAPVVGGGLTAATAERTLGKTASAMGSLGQSFERSSVGAGTKDYMKSLKNRGLMEVDEEGALGTRLSEAINEIGSKEGWGIFRSPEKLAARNKEALNNYGTKIQNILKITDEKGLVPVLDWDITKETLKKAKAEKRQMQEAFDQVISDINDPEYGWDGTASGLNAWKKSIGERAFKGTAEGDLTPAVQRRLQRAMAKDMELSVKEVVNLSGFKKADTDELFRNYSNHAEVAPVLDEQAAKELGSTPATALRALLRTSGGTLSTPTIIGAALGGVTGGVGGIIGGGLLGAAGSPTGKGLIGSGLNKGSKLAAGMNTGAREINPALAGALANLSQTQGEDGEEKLNGLSSLLRRIVPQERLPSPATDSQSVQRQGQLSPPEQPKTQESSSPNPSNAGKLVNSLFGNDMTKTTKGFDKKLDQVSSNLDINPTHLKKVIAFETGGTFDPAEKNRAGSGATGLIQFMPATAKELTGAKTKEAAIALMESMSPDEQLDYVQKYLQPFKGKIKTIEDLYMAVLWPKAVGKDNQFALFKEGTKAYFQNRGLDLDDDGVITKDEAASKVRNYKV